MASAEYSVRLATAEDLDNIMILISEDFLREETIHQGFIAHNTGVYADDLYDHLLNYLETYFSEHLLATKPALVAFEISSGKVVGFLLLKHQGFLNDEPRNNQHGSALVELNYLCYDIGAFLDTTDQLLLMYLVVQKYHRRKGLATMMLQQSIEYAKNHGYDLVYGIFTSEGSKRTARKLRMTSFSDTDLRAVLNDRNRPAFADMGEDNVVSVMGVRISDL